MSRKGSMYFRHGSGLNVIQIWIWGVSLEGLHVHILNNEIHFLISKLTCKLGKFLIIIKEQKDIRFQVGIIFIFGFFLRNLSPFPGLF